MARHEDLGEFLKFRRARIDPQGTGLPPSGPRRVAGLRRAELAHLAGISAEYYQRLEQGRAANPSDEVLDALARVLELATAEREHLYALAHPGRRTTEFEPPEPRPQLLRMLGLIDAVPALLITDLFDVPAANTKAHNLFGAMIEKNMARALFLDPAARVFYRDWDEIAAITVAQLRRSAGRYPDDPATLALIDELSTASTDFTHCWAAGDVEHRGHGSKLLCHPDHGDLDFDYENLELPGDPRQRIVTFTPRSAAGEACR
ncbi:helix-turn-helix transcriptional regulator [Nocardia sp. NPDC088792]|uniref:helix-turn-helix transcriptional regulator n=1 Tax=Nocardia sp. NPDC088792 TaxID=3364332 RepID=UPI00381A9D01